MMMMMIIIIIIIVIITTTMYIVLSVIMTKVIARVHPVHPIWQFAMYIATPLQELTCHMGSDSVTCHPADVTFSPSPHSRSWYLI